MIVSIHYQNPISDIYKIQIIADDLYDLDIQSVICDIDTNTVLEKLRIIEGVRHRHSNPVHLENTKNYIEGLFLNYQLDTKRHSFSYDNYEAANIIGIKYGSEEDTTIIINGHFDTVPNSPGADDNASGVVGVLEAARILSRFNFKHTIRFIAFDLEELGYIGDEMYVEDVLSTNENIVGVFSLDMIGYYSDEPYSQSVPYPEILQILYPEEYNEFVQEEFKGNFLLNMANESSGELISQFDSSAVKYVPELKIVSLAVPESIASLFGGMDSYPFWGAGYNALLLSDGGGSYRNPYYHTSGDTVGTLHLSFMTNVIRSVVAATIELADFQHFGIGYSDTFRIDSIPLGIAVQQLDQTPLKFGLLNIYPNPFNQRAIIEVNIPVETNLKLQVYDIRGRLIEILFEGSIAGSYKFNWDAKGQSTGIYIIQMQTPYYNKKDRCLLLK
jgi:hypothetical protein